MLAVASRERKCAPIPIGERGFHAVLRNDGVDIRMFNRAFAKDGDLVETWKGIFLTKPEWYQLLHVSANVAEGLESVKEGADVKFQLGNRGLYVVVSIFKGIPLVHIRAYSRSFQNADQIFPTKRGIALLQAEWKELCQKYDNIGSLLERK